MHIVYKIWLKIKCLHTFELLHFFFFLVQERGMSPNYIRQCFLGVKHLQDLYKSYPSTLKEGNENNEYLTLSSKHNSQANQRSSYSHGKHTESWQRSFRLGSFSYSHKKGLVRYSLSSCSCAEEIRLTAVFGVHLRDYKTAPIIKTRFTCWALPLFCHTHLVIS